MHIEQFLKVSWGFLIHGYGARIIAIWHLRVDIIKPYNFEKLMSTPRDLAIYIAFNFTT